MKYPNLEIWFHLSLSDIPSIFFINNQNVIARDFIERYY